VSGVSELTPVLLHWATTARGREAQKVEASAFAANVLPIIETLRASGVRNLRGFASALNNRGVRTARGGRSHVSNVKNLLDRLPG